MKKITLEAKKLVDEFKPHVYCYMGSGMLSNDYDERTVLHNAKICAVISVNKIIEAMDKVLFPNPFKMYYEELINEINNLKHEQKQ